MTFCGKEERRRECALIFAKNRSKRYKACSDAVPLTGIEAGLTIDRRYIGKTAATTVSIVCEMLRISAYRSHPISNNKKAPTPDGVNAFLATYDIYNTGQMFPIQAKPHSKRNNLANYASATFP